MIGGQGELFVDDMKLFESRVKNETNCEILMLLHPTLFHDFCLLPLTESEIFLDEIVIFIQKHTDKQ